MERTEIARIYASPETFAGQEITVCGWVRTIRDSKSLGFSDMNDGSYFKGIQVVFEEHAIPNFSEITKQNVGAAFIVTGTLILTPEAKQPFEIKANQIVVEGTSSPDYPLQKKRHSMEDVYKRQVQIRNQERHAPFSHPFVQFRPAYYAAQAADPPDNRFIAALGKRYAIQHKLPSVCGLPGER